MKDLFQDLKLKDILACLKLLGATESESVTYINNRYIDVGENFSGVIKFLEEIELVQIIDGTHIIRSENFHVISAVLLNSSGYRAVYFLDYIKSDTNKSFYQFHKYLEEFHVVNGRLGYLPLKRTNIKYSGIRNFLIELGIVQYSQDDGFYYINDDYAQIIFSRSREYEIHQEDLERRLRDQREIGLLAELQIVLYEEVRLSSRADLAHMIDHVGQKIVNAGYDIKSHELDSPIDNPVERYIEVKAIPRDSIRFYWTLNEVNQAKECKGQYYLYLLPVLRKNTFDLNNLIVIADPYSSVFINRNDWDITETNFCLEKRII